MGLSFRGCFFDEGMETPLLACHAIPTVHEKYHPASEVRLRGLPSGNWVLVLSLSVTGLWEISFLALLLRCLICEVIRVDSVNLKVLSIPTASQPLIWSFEMFGNKAQKINALNLSGDWRPGVYLAESSLLLFQNPNKRKFGLQVLLLWVIAG